jgi:hypothetical protein
MNRRSVVLAAVLGACTPGAKPGALVGSYTVHGVLVENTCGQSALPTSNPLDFVVEIRTDAGVAFWIPNKAAQNTGTLSDSGSFRFTTSETRVVMGSAGPRQLEPMDFQAGGEDFDLQQPRTCALTLKQTVLGTLGRRILDGSVNASADASGDLSAEHQIEVTPSTGSDCNAALAALGGSYLALPCEARYVLTGSLDTTDATLSAGSAGTGTSSMGAAGR